MSACKLHVSTTTLIWNKTYLLRLPKNHNHLREILTQIPQMIDLTPSIETDKNYICLNELYSCDR